MNYTMGQAFGSNFLGHSPTWYKQTIVAFLILNPILFLWNPTLAGWALVLEFIFTLAMALKCYPLQPGGLLALEAVIIGMTHPEHVYQEVLTNFPVIMLLIFMVAGIYFLKELLLLTLTTESTPFATKNHAACLLPSIPSTQPITGSKSP